ncbi:MAG: matrixin family metalloprotease [Acidobacteria bacterium]|nr:matrixin family metalloprotease [Acidobacteriota bacterium]
MKTAAVALLGVLLAWSEPASAYLKYTVRAGAVSLPVTWSGPVRYFVNDASTVPGVSVAAFDDAVARAFAAWEAVPTASVRYEPGGLTSARPLDDDGRSTLGFMAAPELDRVLASTSLLVDDASGEIVEADIFFNSAFEWSVAPAGEAGRFDLESIAVHEIGHLSGLGHSALGETEMVAGGRRLIAAESVMFPIAFPPGNIVDRTLKPDDVAGISDLYPDAGFAAETGSLSGLVTLDDAGVFGAHVVAFSPATGALVGGFSLTEDGQFSIGGLSPGVYVVRVEPLDDADPESFFAGDPLDVSTDFRVRFYDRLVPVPKGADSGLITVRLEHK